MVHWLTHLGILDVLCTDYLEFHYHLTSTVNGGGKVKRRKFTFPRRYGQKEKKFAIVYLRVLFYLFTNNDLRINWQSGKIHYNFINFVLINFVKEKKYVK